MRRPHDVPGLEGLGPVMANLPSRESRATWPPAHRPTERKNLSAERRSAAYLIGIRFPAKGLGGKYLSVLGTCPLARAGRYRRSRVLGAVERDTPYSVLGPLDGEYNNILQVCVYHLRPLMNRYNNLFVCSQVEYLGTVHRK